MKKFNFLVILVLLFLSCNNETKNEITKIEVLKNNYDFGKITIQDTIIYTFKIKNISDRKLKINNIATSCGCTTIGEIDSIADKNEEVNIKVQFIPKKEQIDSYVSNSIVLETNTVPPYIIFRLKGNVVK
ncbi:MAG: DUF1573 domain-containing protein [Flavobacteriaceae bacterium]